MLQIGLNTVVSLDVVERCFCCDLGRCRGQCCIDGDAGAPVTDDEVSAIESIMPQICDKLTGRAKDVIGRQGISYRDQQGELVLSIVDGGPCIFCTEGADGITYCAIDSAYRRGDINVQKPVSCALYPIRINKYPSFTAVNYHHWDICQSACEHGNDLQLPVYKFLREPLIRRFGQQWYDELDLVAQQWLRRKKRRQP